MPSLATGESTGYSDGQFRAETGRGLYFMRIRRRLPIIVGVLLVAAAVVLVVQLRRHAPPEPARLLPGADGFFYVNLQWVRRVNAIGPWPPVSHDPEYQRFIEETGIEFERDLNRAAFAVHYPAGQGSKRGVGGGEVRFSEVFEGSIHAEKLTAYLRKISQSVDNYHSVDIFSIPLEGRTVRVAILGVDTVAVSNHDDPATIRGIIDRSRKLASPFAGPAFLRQYYKEVPIASLAWAIVRVDSSNSRSPLAGGAWSLLFPKPAVVVASARYLRALHLRAEAFAQNEDDAQSIADQTNNFIGILHTAESSTSDQGADPDIRAFFSSLKVDHEGKRAVLTALVPPGFIRKVFTEPPPLPPGPEEKSSPTPFTPPGKTVKKKAPVAK